MRVRIIAVPYDTGQKNVRMGRGPSRILAAGAEERLKGQGHEVAVIEVDAGETFPAEIATAFAVMRLLAELVRATLDVGAFPLVLAGNCSATVGVVSGLSPRKAGVVWFDAHADIETPETTMSGFLDGMGLAILTGRCWRALAREIPGFRPVEDRNVILAGARDIDPSESHILEDCEIVHLSDESLSRESTALQSALADLAGRTDGVHLHLDLDVHDPQIAPANHYRPPGGLAPERLRQLVETIGSSVPILAAALTAYDPDADPEGATLASGLALLETVVSSARRG